MGYSLKIQVLWDILWRFKSSVTFAEYSSLPWHCALSLRLQFLAFRKFIKNCFFTDNLTLTVTATVYVETSGAVTLTTQRNVSEELNWLNLWVWVVRWKYQVHEYFYHHTSELILRSIFTGICKIFKLSTQLIVLYYILFWQPTHVNTKQKPAA
jgi:hypothetical protein